MYSLLCSQLKELIESCPVPVSAMANASSLLYYTLPDLNWAGFYLLSGDTLLLGPFQGRVACTKISMGRGVCGTAAQTRSIQRVLNVHEFPGHIACDSRSNSEIVIPLIQDGTLYGVLDLDSPLFSRFSEEDQEGLQAFCDVLMTSLDWSRGLMG